LLILIHRMQVPLLSRIFKFGITGCSGLLIDFSITYFLKEKVRINKYIANATGFTCAVISNFFLNKYWTFNSVTNIKPANQFFMFITISVVGLCINSGVIMLLVNKIRTRFYFSKVIAVCIVFAWNFFMNNYITFSPLHS
jgi:putative flippase GtrA